MPSPDTPDAAAVPDGALPLRDALGRPLRDLRVSITDRCNFRCTYCMPRERFAANDAFLPRSSLLSFEEIRRLASAFVRHGVRKIRLTGGEPLLRKDVERLVAMLAELRTPGGQPVELSLTTNGSLLARKAVALKAAGLQRVTVSLDALDDAVFRRMNDVDFPVAEVLRGIEAAQRAGLAPVKVNTVVQRGVNEAQVPAIVKHFRGTGVVPRFIESMDVGGAQWHRDQVVPSAELLQRLQQAHVLVPVAPAHRGETARRWMHADGCGEIGFISSVTQAFCGDCSRARLSADGQMYLCLFGRRGVDLRGPVRDGTTDAGLSERIAAAWQQRADRYSELRGTAAAARLIPIRPVAMHYIGG
ncbi:GTP 3',8-cyclase MoaA [Ideonella sp. BN130291]|uniref:GTP 3',8-cyclase MoaA n=1 Tax=Ideonella sp. BN130291 TaxID=3112940 RepID=UPI002E26609A|nr:GTP 3',8-cyclase MoaA [Ideonella sp. BN130291]